MNLVLTVGENLEPTFVLGKVDENPAMVAMESLLCTLIKLLLEPFVRGLVQCRSKYCQQKIARTYNENHNQSRKKQDRNYVVNFLEHSFSHFLCIFLTIGIPLVLHEKYPACDSVFSNFQIFFCSYFHSYRYIFKN